MTPSQGTATNEQQRVALTGSPTTGDDFTLALGEDGDPTAAIAFDASASAVGSALEATDDVAPGDVAVTGAAGGPWDITFQGDLAEQDVPKLVADGTGIADGDVDVTVLVPGRAEDTTNTGVVMHAGDSDEPQGPEDALGEGEKRGDYSERGDGSQHFEGGREQEYGPHGDHADQPTAKGGVTTTPSE